MKSLRLTALPAAVVMLFTALTVSGLAQPAMADLPDDCAIGALTPFRRSGLVVAVGEVECTEIPRLMRLRVKLQRRVDGIWRHRAVAIGTSQEPVSSILVEALAPCRLGKHRTRVAFWFRDDHVKPWELGLRRLTSPGRMIRNCP